MTSLSDRELAAEAAAGSAAAGEELFMRHWLPAWRLAFSMTASAAAADDVAQDAFERAFRSLATFNGRSSFRTWLSRIVINRAIDASRRQRHLASLPAENELSSAWSDEPALGDPDLLNAVLALPPQRKAVIVLRYWIGHSPPEIADILGVPVGTVHSRLARGLAELRSQLEVRDVSEH